MSSVRSAASAAHRAMPAKPEGYWTERAVSFPIFHFSTHDERDVAAYYGGLRENSRPVYQ